jgi:hypothetical protein
VQSRKDFSEIFINDFFGMPERVSNGAKHGSGFAAMKEVAESGIPE